MQFSNEMKNLIYTSSRKNNEIIDKKNNLILDISNEIENIENDINKSSFFKKSELKSKKSILIQKLHNEKKSLDDYIIQLQIQSYIHME